MESWRAAAAAAVGLRPIGEPKYFMHGAPRATSLQAKPFDSTKDGAVVDNTAILETGRAKDAVAKSERDAVVPQVAEGPLSGNSDKSGSSMHVSDTECADHDADVDSVVQDEIEHEDDSDDEIGEEQEEELVTSLPTNPASVSPVTRPLRLKPPTTSATWASVEAETNERVERYGLVVVLRDKVDRHASWLACKLCAAFGCENGHNSEMQVQIFPRPFTEARRLISHVTKQHPRIWARFDRLNAGGKEAMFEGRQWSMTVEDLQKLATALNLKQRNQYSKEALAEAHARRKKKMKANKERLQQLREGPNGEQFRGELARQKAENVQRRKAFLETPVGQAIHLKQREKRASRQRKRRSRLLELGIDRNAKRRNVHIPSMNNAANEATQLNN